jgi:hypothetical protein
MTDDRMALVELIEHFNGKWAWDKAAKLLDANNSEPSRSSILALFEPYEQRQPPVVQEISSAWLDLSFADAARLDAVVAEVLAV